MWTCFLDVSVGLCTEQETEVNIVNGALFIASLTLRASRTHGWKDILTVP